MRSGRVVLLVLIPARGGLFGLGFLVEAVAEGDAHVGEWGIVGLEGARDGCLGC